jgi:hypothetical protein
MRAIDRVGEWPVDHVSAATVVIDPSGRATVGTAGDQELRYRIASIAKTITAWATFVAVEEGLLALDTAIGQPGCTLRHLLSHAGGYPFDGPRPIAAPGRRRIYSNTGIEMAADAVADAAAMPFGQYLSEAVLEPLGMAATELRGSPAHAMWSSCHDLARFTMETMRPTLIGSEMADAAVRPAFPDLRGIVPGIGRYERCSWGLGFEIKGDKVPHWTGARNSPQTLVTSVVPVPSYGWIWGQRTTDQLPAWHSPIARSTIGPNKPLLSGRRSATPCLWRHAGDAASGRPGARGDHGRRRVPGGQVRLRRRRQRRRRSGGGDARRRARWR